MVWIKSIRYSSRLARVAFIATVTSSPFYVPSYVSPFLSTSFFEIFIYFNSFSFVTFAHSTWFFLFPYMSFLGRIRRGENRKNL